MSRFERYLEDGIALNASTTIQCVLVIVVMLAGCQHFQLSPSTPSQGTSGVSNASGGNVTSAATDRSMFSVTGNGGAPAVPVAAPAQQDTLISAPGLAYVNGTTSAGSNFRYVFVWPDSQGFAPTPMCFAPHGEQVELLSEANGFFSVQYKNCYGWIRKSLASKVKPPAQNKYMTESDSLCEERKHVYALTKEATTLSIPGFGFVNGGDPDSVFAFRKVPVWPSSTRDTTEPSCMLPHGEHVLTAAEQGIFVEVKTPTCRGWIKKELLSSSRPPCQKSLEQIYVESGLSPSEAAEKAAQFRKHEADMEERAQQTKLLKEQEKQREEKAAQEKAKKEAKRKKEKEIDAMFEEMENGGSRSTPRCKTGIPCGNSCISAKKKCHK